MSDDLVTWFKEANGFAQGMKAPHKWVLQAEQELRFQGRRIEELEAKLAKALTALSDVQWFVKDLEPYADQGHTLVPALQKACAVYVELTGGKDE